MTPTHPTFPVVYGVSAGVRGGIKLRSCLQPPLTLTLSPRKIGGREKLSYVGERDDNFEGTMPTHVLLAVLAAAVLHASWNAMLKGRTGDPLVTSTWIAIGAAVVALPALVVSGVPQSASLPYVAASAIVHVGYFVLVGLAYRAADYSAVYPLVRGGAPLFTVLLGAALLGERPAPLAAIGVCVLCAGVIGLGRDGLRRGGLDRRALACVASLIAVIVGYTLIDGIGARVSGNAAGYVLAMMALNGALMLLTGLWLRGRALLPSVGADWGQALVGGAMVLISYGTALWAMTKAPIGLVGALRETSVLFAALIATFGLGERFGPARWLAAVAIVLGLALIQLH